MSFMMLKKSLEIGNRVICCRRVCSKPPLEIPEEPTTCCMSGCANCVWIEYAADVKKVLEGTDSKKVAQMILEKVQDPNMKAFLSMELKTKGF